MMAITELPLSKNKVSLLKELDTFGTYDFRAQNPCQAGSLP